MELYTYKGISSGKYIEGEIEAINQEEASHKLKEQKIIITNLIKSKKKKDEKKEKSKGAGFSFFKKKVKTEDILIFSKQFATMVKAGLPILQILTMLRDQLENPAMKEIIEDIRKSLEGGVTLSKCFEKYPLLFDNVYVNLIKAGEASGKLDVFLRPTAIGSAVINQIGAKNKFYLLGAGKAADSKEWNDVMIKRLKNDNATIPAGTYSNQLGGDVRTTIANNSILVRGDMDNGLVYKMVKATWENLGEIHKSAVVLRTLSPKNAFAGVNLPLHPGAVKYYKEVGIKIPAEILP